MESFRIFCKFTDTLKSCLTLWKVSRHSGKFPDSLESLEKLSRYSGNFPDNLETLRTLLKVFRVSRNSRVLGNLPDYLESSKNVHKLSRASTYFQQHFHNVRSGERNSIRYRGSNRPHLPV